MLYAAPMKLPITSIGLLPHSIGAFALSAKAAKGWPVAARQASQVPAKQLVYATCTTVTTEWRSRAGASDQKLDLT